MKSNIIFELPYRSCYRTKRQNIWFRTRLIPSTFFVYNNSTCTYSKSQNSQKAELYKIENFLEFSIAVSGRNAPGLGRRLTWSARPRHKLGTEAGRWRRVAGVTVALVTGIAARMVVIGGAVVVVTVVARCVVWPIDGVYNQTDNDDHQNVAECGCRGCLFRTVEQRSHCCYHSEATFITFRRRKTRIKIG